MQVHPIPIFIIDTPITGRTLFHGSCWKRFGSLFLQMVINHSPNKPKGAVGQGSKTFPMLMHQLKRRFHGLIERDHILRERSN